MRMESIKKLCVENIEKFCALRSKEMVIKNLISHKLEKNSLLQNLNEISNKILVTLKVIISLTDLLLE